MLLLAVEASTHTGTLSLSDDNRVIAERVLAAEGRRHAQTLVQDVSQLLSEHGRTAADLRAVAVSVGPGSFTGLRVGVVFAKTYAWAAGIWTRAGEIRIARLAELEPVYIRPSYAEEKRGAVGDQSGKGQ